MYHIMRGYPMTPAIKHPTIGTVVNHEFQPRSALPTYIAIGGAKDETGVGNIWNAPLSPGDDGENFRTAFSTQIAPALDEFAPDLVLVSAGFDAHLRDPLAQLRLGEEDFRWVTEKLLETAAKHSGGKLVSTLEGGYDLDALASSTAVHVRTLMGA
jgi:acetoin utilization deacetylase AcuC-like enzyme